jgi:hypothetical protein
MWMTKRDGYMIYRYTTVHARFPLVFSGVRVTRSLVVCVCCAYHCLSFCTVSFSHCVVCSSSIYDYDYIFGIFKRFLCNVCHTWFKDIQQFMLVFPQLLNVCCETLIYVREVRMEL